MHDKRLVNRFLITRSERAFSSLYTNKTPAMYQLALRLTAHDKNEADELVQEMWIIAIRKLEFFEWKSSLKTWLTGILINLSRERRKAAEKLSVLPAEYNESVEIEDVSKQLTTEDLEMAIAKLPPGYRQVVLLHDIEGLKHKEIAELLDISEGTSKSQLYRARKTLRALLTEQSSINRNS